MIASFIASRGPIEIADPDDVVGRASSHAVSVSVRNWGNPQLIHEWVLSRQGQKLVATSAAARSTPNDPFAATNAGVDKPGRAEINILWWSQRRCRRTIEDDVIRACNASRSMAEGTLRW